MHRHVVREGECVISLAARVGCTVAEIWDHSDNRDLRERRQHPGVLSVGDEIVLPREPSSSGGETKFSLSPGDDRQLSGELRMTHLRLKLVAPTGGEAMVRTRRTEEGDNIVEDEPDVSARDPDEPLIGVAFRLEVGSRVIEDETNSEGMIDVEVPASATRAKLILEPGTEYELQTELLLGYLEPFDEPRGILQRLSNLGISVDHHSDAGGVGLAAALSEFQAKHGLEISGTLDDATRDAIREKHGI